PFIEAGQRRGSSAAAATCRGLSGGRPSSRRILFGGAVIAWMVAVSPEAALHRGRMNAWNIASIAQVAVSPEAALHRGMMPATSAAMAMMVAVSPEAALHRGLPGTPHAT